MNDFTDNPAVLIIAALLVAVGAVLLSGWFYTWIFNAGLGAWLGLGYMDYWTGVQLSVFIMSFGAFIKIGK